MYMPSPTPWAGEYNVPHGLANAVILPMVLEAMVKRSTRSGPALQSLQAWPRKILPVMKPPAGSSRLSRI